MNSWSLLSCFSSHIVLPGEAAAIGKCVWHEAVLVCNKADRWMYLSKWHPNIFQHCGTCGCCLLINQNTALQHHQVEGIANHSFFEKHLNIYSPQFKNSIFLSTSCIVVFGTHSVSSRCLYSFSGSYTCSDFPKQSLRLLFLLSVKLFFFLSEPSSQINNTALAHLFLSASLCLFSLLAYIHISFYFIF